MTDGIIKLRFHDLGQWRALELLQRSGGFIVLDGGDHGLTIPNNLWTEIARWPTGVTNEPPLSPTQHAART